MSDDTGSRQKLGKILLKQKQVTAEELDALLADKRDPGARLASKAIAAGKISETGALRALSAQQGVPAIDLRQVVIPTELLELIPQEIAAQHLVLPFALKDDQLSLAMAEPGARHVIDEIEFVTGKRVFPYVALADALREAIDEAYANRNSAYYVGPDVTPQHLAQLGVDTTRPVQAPSTGFTSIPLARMDDRREQGPSDHPPPHDVFGGGAAMTLDDGTPLPPLDPAFATGEMTPEGDPIAPPAKDPGSQRVLVVDDEADIRNMLRRLLEAEGIEVLEAVNGVQALKVVREQLPHLILLDAMLPGVHGFDIARRLRDSQRYGHIPIVMISAVYRGWRFAEDLRKAYGIAHYVEKPFKIQELRDVVLGLLAGREPPTRDPDECNTDAGGALSNGIAAFQAGDLDGAISHLEAGVAVDPLAFRLHYHLGLLFGKRGDLFRAIQSLECAADLQPRHFAALKNLAVAYQKAGFRHKAVEMWERALGSAPDDQTRTTIKQQVIGLL